MNTREKLRSVILKAPKPQLHLHLDGSISHAFIQQSIAQLIKANDCEEAGKTGTKKSDFFFGTSIEPQNELELRTWLMTLKAEQINNNSVANKNSNWKIFDFCNQFLQTEQQLNSATHELVTRLSRMHNVNYMEIRFAPILHTVGMLSEKDAVVAVVQGFKSAVDELSKTNVRVNGGIILCALRSYPLEKAFETVKLCKNTAGVIGFDIAGDEGSYPLSLFTDALKMAKSLDVKVTVHAGEWSEVKYPESLQNVKLAAELNIDRIGHGLALRSASKEFMNELSNRKIPLEVCLTSNCGNPSKCKDFSEHPLPLFIRSGISIAGLNVDNLLLSGNLHIGSPDPTEECVRALLDCGLSPAELFTLIECGYKAGFVNDLNLIENSLMEWKNVYLPEIEKILEIS